MIELIEPYTPRPIRSLGQWIEAGIRLKVHGIAYHMAWRELAQLLVGRNHYGVGFVGVHDGRGAIFNGRLLLLIFCLN